MLNRQRTQRVVLRLFLVGLSISSCGQVSQGFAREAGLPALERVGEEGFQLLREWYAYDKTIPLEARIVEKKEVAGVEREKIVLRTTQGFLAPGYLQLPTVGEGPYPCVLLLHGWSGSKESWYEDDNYISGGNIRKGLLEQGFAVFALDAHCHGDRIAENDYAVVNHYADESQPVGSRRKGYFTQQEIYLQTVVDYRRVLDYLETRSEIDAQRFGLVGYSMGGTQSFLLTGVEERIKVTVACATPADAKRLSLIAPQNYVRGIGQRPFFMVMGSNDSMCPVPRAEQLFELIESTTKQLKFYGGSHKLTPDFVPHAVEWVVEHLR
ncbi:MAG: alpha/beta fold hydrolase [Planctomycetales bacterium]|nr:alpha/beta fold hydrolase [Planctomycetales bacterium]